MIKYLTTNTTAELICLLIAVFTLYKDKNRTWRYFWLFLLVTVFTELSSIYLKTHGTPKTTWLYTIYTIFEIGFISNMLRNILSAYVNRWIIFNAGVLTLILIYVLEIAIYKSFNIRPNITNTCFDIFVILTSLYYLYYLLKDDHYISLGKDSNFWWVAGTLFLHFSFISLNILYDLLKDNFSKPGPLFSFTFKLLNVFFYSIWSYAFICRKWTMKN